MLQFLGRWLFRLSLLPWAALIFAWAVVMSTVDRLLGWSRESWHVALGDRLVAKGAVIVPVLLTSFADTYQDPHDGPGWSAQQIPRLWDTCRGLAQRMGCPPPDAIHLSVEPGDCFAWTSREGSGPARRHIALSLLDLRLMTQDEAHSVIAHEVAHAGLGHSLRMEEQAKQLALMQGALEAHPVLLLPVWLAQALYVSGASLGAHDIEREADRKAAEVVGGNHASAALRRGYLQGPALGRMFQLVLTRAQSGPRAPLRLAEAAARLFLSFDLPQVRQRASERAELDGAMHPSLPARVEAAEQEPNRLGVGGGKINFIDAYPELLTAEELLTKTYFPDTPVHARSDASQLRRKALAARLKRR